MYKKNSIILTIFFCKYFGLKRKVNKIKKKRIRKKWTKKIIRKERLGDSIRGRKKK